MTDSPDYVGLCVACGQKVTWQGDPSIQRKCCICGSVMQPLVLAEPTEALHDVLYELAEDLRLGACNQCSGLLKAPRDSETVVCPKCKRECRPVWLKESVPCAYCGETRPTIETRCFYMEGGTPDTRATGYSSDVVFGPRNRRRFSRTYDVCLTCLDQFRALKKEF